MPPGLVVCRLRGQLGYDYSHAMECEEKARLVEEHHVAALAFSQAVRTLNGRTKTSNVAEY